MGLFEIGSWPSLSYFHYKPDILSFIRSMPGPIGLWASVQAHIHRSGPLTRLQKRGKIPLYSLFPSAPFLSSSDQSTILSRNRFSFLSTGDARIAAEMSGDSRKRDRRDLRSFKRQKKQRRSTEEELESKLGFDLFSEGEKKLGWLLTFAPVSTSWSYSLNLTVHS